MKRVLVHGNYDAARMWAEENDVSDWVHVSSAERLLGFHPDNATLVFVYGGADRYRVIKIARSRGLLND